MALLASLCSLLLASSPLLPLRLVWWCGEKWSLLQRRHASPRLPLLLRPVYLLLLVGSCLILLWWRPVDRLLLLTGLWLILLRWGSVDLLLGLSWR